MTELAIRVDGLCKQYGETAALAGFDLAVPAGTVCGLLGPNGAGKTTAVRILTTLLRPDGGRAEVAGFDVVRQARRVRERIGLVGQHPAVEEALSGRQNLELFGRLHHLGAAAAAGRATDLLDRFGLADTGRKPVSAYSGGMRRRLDLAASMITAPAVLFLDEPTTGLDPRGRNEMWQAIRSLVSGGTTVLLTTQYLDEADQLAGRISVIGHGKVIADGTPDELKSTVGGDRLDVVLRAAADLPAAAAVIGRVSGAEPDVDQESRRIGVPVRDRVGALTEVVAALHEAGIRAEDIALRRPTLDEAFLHIMGKSALVPATPAASQCPRMSGLTSSAGSERQRATEQREGEKAETGTALRPRAARASLRASAIQHWTIARRDFARWARQPGPVIVGLLFPVLIVLMFGYLFGGAMIVPGGGDYREFLMPGMFAMTMLFGMEATMIAVSTDAARGVTDRFRSMPMAPSAVVAGRSIADMVNSGLGLAIMIVCGLLVGWRAHGGVAETALAIVVLLALRFAVLWVGIYLGLVVRSPESVVMVQILVWPVTFLASTFVPPDTMPGWLGAIAEWNPLSATVSAVRDLFGNPGAGGDSWIAQHATLMAIVWPVLIVAVFLPLAVRRYQRLGR